MTVPVLPSSASAAREREVISAMQPLALSRTNSMQLCTLGSIQIQRHEAGYRVEFVGGDVDEILEQIEE